MILTSHSAFSIFITLMHKKTNKKEIKRSQIKVNMTLATSVLNFFVLHFSRDFD